MIAVSISDETQAVVPGEAEAREAVPAFQRFMERIGGFWTLGVLVLLIVVFGIAAPSLFTKQAWLATSNYAVEYLIPNLEIKVEFFDGKAVGIELPQTVILTVIETEPGLKSATASSVTKAAKTETGLVVQVPPFINEGEKIKVDTSEGAYLSRA